MFIILMGVAGSGKTTVGKRLAEKLGCPFYDGDDFHPAANIAKMANGIPLTDEDRAGWLAALAAVIRAGLARGECGVVACSALKEKYREVLRVDARQVKFFYLRGSYELLLKRMASRTDHYMKPEMLKSQFATLEEPSDIPWIDVTLTPDEIVSRIVAQLADKPYSIGLVGLGVMGRNLALNFERNGYSVVGYDLAPQLPPDFPVRLVKSLAELASLLETPRVILLMVPAGAAVDSAIASMKPYLQPGDIIIDGGNSYFTDTERRVNNLSADGIQFVGMGISGGESGALWGPSLMPGGAEWAWQRIQPMFQAIAARAEDGVPCVAWMGRGGAGHYVKTVHNGIEYGDMQLIAEIYDLLHRGAGVGNAELAGIFARWNEGELHSYLIEITGEILRQQDEETGESLVDLILDQAAQKGTGKWTSQSALDVGAAIPTLSVAVESRLLSNLKEERVAAAQVLGQAGTYSGDRGQLIAASEQALYASKIITYTQGLSLLKMASDEFGWDMDLAGIVRVWRAGCIIRAALLGDIAAAFERNPKLPSLLLEDTFKQAVLNRESAWRQVMRTAVDLGIPMLATSASLGYFDSYRSERLPANLIQAQRDYFGAHTYRRVDRPGVFHTRWKTNKPGPVS